MIISIPVSPLTYGVLMIEYPSHERSATIVATSHSLLAKTLMAKRPAMRIESDHLTKVIHVSTKKNLHLTHDELTDIGIILHLEHQQVLMRWVQASVKAGTTASHGIRTFMDHYDLDDDALNQETAFRTWQRFVTRQVDLTSRPKSEILSPPKSRAELWDENRFACFIAEIVEYLYNSNNTWNNIRLQHLRLLAYNNAGHGRIDPLGMKYNSATVAIANIRKWIDGHVKVAKAWERYYSH